MGGAVAGVGRVDDDDFDDVIVGAPWNDAAGNSSGRAYVYSGQTGSEIYRFTGSERGDQCGWAVDGIGDYNGDGYNDVVIGAPRNDASADRKGMVYVCSGEDGSVLQTFEGSAAGERFGRDVSGVADIDNDGVRDLIVGAWGHSTTAYQAGGVFAYSLGACEICPIAVDGDVNESGAVTSADIIHLVGYVFKGDVAPLPCDANGDVDCSDAVTSADIIYLVNFVFKGGPPPCDICSDSPMLCILFEVSSGRRPG